MKTAEQLKTKALALYLGIKENEIAQEGYDENIYEADGAQYLVLTDSEADEKAAENIKDSVWAFNASFLANYTDLPEEIFTALSEKCESANDPILKLIERSKGGLQGFIEEAISADGRGHFIGHYDHEEGEADDYFIYRTN